MPCSLMRPSLCCAQIVNTPTFMSQQTKQMLHIFHKPTCKSQYAIYLMECILCKILYFENPRPPLRLNHHYETSILYIYNDYK